MSRTPSPSLFHSCPGGDAGGTFCVGLLAISYLCVAALDRATALQTLTDPNRAIKNLWSQCKGQGGSGKTHIKWLTEITMPSHTSAGHSHTNPQLHPWPAPGHTASPRTHWQPPGHTDSPQTAKLISIPELETCNRVWGGVWNSACLCKEVQNRINFLVYTKNCTGAQGRGSDKDELHPVPASLFRHILNSTENAEDKFRCLWNEGDMQTFQIIWQRTVMVVQYRCQLWSSVNEFPFLLDINDATDWQYNIF